MRPHNDASSDSKQFPCQEQSAYRSAPLLFGGTSSTPCETRFFKKLLKGLRYAPRVMITDKLASYGAARKQMRLSIEHRQHKGLNNRAENSHQPTRQKERQMEKFKSPGKVQRFLSAHGPINNPFLPRRHLLKATAYRAARKQAFSTWLEAIDHAVAA